MGYSQPTPRLGQWRSPGCRKHPPLPRWSAGDKARCADPSPSAQHDDAPGLGVYPAVVAVRPDTCGEAEGLVTLREVWTDA